MCIQGSYIFLFVQFGFEKSEFSSFETATVSCSCGRTERIFKRVSLLAEVWELSSSVECTRRISGVEVMKAGKQDEQGKRVAGQKFIRKVIRFLLN